MNGALAQIAAVFVAIIGLATVAVILSRNSNTAQVTQAAFGGLSSAIGAAVSPITGGAGSYGNIAGLSPSF
jgi:hypothetical protein